MTNPKGFLVRAYTLMQYRVRKHPSYKSLPICSREDFYTRFEADKGFLKLHADWVESGKTRRRPLRNLRPVPDRIDGWLGYEIDNLRFLTYRENNLRPNRNVRTLCATCLEEPCMCEYRRPLPGQTKRPRR